MNTDIENINSTLAHAETTIEALTLKFKQILERVNSSNEELSGIESTLSSVEKIKTMNGIDPTPLSSTSINTGFLAPSAFSPSEEKESNLPILVEAESVANPLEAPKSEGKTRCPYCDKECEASALRDHTDNCDSRHIECEACGEKVMLDIFDFHLETCTAALYRHYNGHFLYNAGRNNMLETENENENLPHHHEEENWNQEPEPEGEGLFDEDEDDIEGHDGPMSVSDLTYEQLIALDSTIVKKGLTEEELQKCPVEVHLKELDEPVGCNVCLCEAESGEFIRKLPCGHKFHRDCVDTWLKNNITCPSCKKYLR